MKRTIVALALLLPFLFLSGCDHPEARNEDFTLTLHTGKGVYKNGGQLDCYATLHYTGGEEIITVYGDEPTIVFSIKNSAGHVIGGLQNLVLAPREFGENETKTYPYLKSGGYDENTPQWVKDYLTTDVLTLPKGTYTVIAQFEYSHDPQPGVDNDQTLEATKTIRVE
jgi:hypothetical protein